MYLPEAEPEVREVSRYMLFQPKKFVFTKTRPVKIQPVLSPDNYLEEGLKIIKSATKTLYFQNQYIKINADVTPEYEELLNELKDKTNDDSIDCRIILRTQRTDDTRLMLDNLQAYGFNMAKVKVMTNTHTKGIIADSEVVMIGSHNWSNAGVQFNRDASLVIYNEGVAQYYQDVFMHDWDRRTQKKHDEESVIIPDTGTETALMADNVTKLDWKAYLE
jgi:phosphatidylserine/phosphatidylglycerophosphate/cardiolipin synthase-like enzyme